MNAWAPDTLDADLLLADHGPKVAERVLYLGHIVYGRMLRDARFREAGACPLQATLLRDVLGRHHLKAVREVAEAVGYIGRGPSYQAGAYSQSYRILPPHDAGRLRRHPLTDPTLCRAIQRTREKQRAEMWQRIREGPVAPEVCEHLWRDLQRVELADFEPTTPYEQIASDRLRHGRHWFVVDDFGRIHTPLTSLPETMRQHLRVDGAPLVNVDVGESQPMFVGMAIGSRRTTTAGTTPPHHHHHHTTNPRLPYVGHPTPTNEGCATMLDKLPPGIGAYLAACERRGLYQAVADRLGMPREDAKPRVMAVFFGRPHHRTRAAEALETLFPEAWKAIQDLKRIWGYASLAHAAQRAESSFIFGRCVRRLMAERPGLWIATIHDSILTTAGSEGIVHDVMAEEFGRLGLKPTLTVERFAESAC